MDTILYIVIGIAVMAFQIYSEKKKKEQQAAARQRKPSTQSYATPTEPKREPVSQNPFSFVASSLIDEEHSENPFEFYYEELDEGSISAPVADEVKIEEVKPSTFSKHTVQSILDEQSANSKSEVEDIYSSDEISGDKYNESGLSIDLLKEKFDPRLFILYSVLAAPKFRD
jgi:hypothetical protein